MESGLAVESVAVADSPYTLPERRTRVIVIGGGLAGMGAALRLAEHGCQVSLYESSDRLGGKAGSNLNERGEYDDHGFHIFPRWYLNIWQLVDDLRIRDRFTDLHDFFQLRDRDYSELPVHRFKTLHEAAVVWNLVRNLRSSPLPIHETLLFFYSTIDLATHSLKQKERLDQISIIGFLRSKFYRTKQMATVYQDLMLKAISVPSYFVSAMTTRHVIRYWMKYPSPMHSVLRGNLQQCFIEPFRRHLRKLDVEIFLKHQLLRLDVEGERVVSVRMADSESRESTLPVDQIVLAIPAEKVQHVCTSEVYKQCTTLGNIRNLRARPMAALNLYFRNRIPNLPSSHVNLIDSKYGLTFIDVARVWDDGPEGSILNVIATDYTELEGVTDETAADKIVEELKRFIPFDGNEVTMQVMAPHLKEPLFMNDVGIWHFRPNPVPVAKDESAEADLGIRRLFGAAPPEKKEPVELHNLFLAGDYCRSHVDLVSMEGAFTTGLLAANALLKKQSPNADLKDPMKPEGISVLWWFVWLFGLPFAAMLRLSVFFFPTRVPIRKPASAPTEPVAPRMRT